jgi:photosystem II stability/assembly factor-like uncharacterized protein
MNTKVFLACHDSGISRAGCGPDGDWVVERLIPDQPVTCLAGDPSNPLRVYAGTRRGVLRSDDGGRTWRASGMDGQIVKSLAVSPHAPQVIYAGTKPALMFVSRDGGGTWTELESFRRIPNRWWWFSPAEPPDRRPYVISIALSPVDPGVLLAGVEFGAVVRSDDGGVTWSRHRPGALRDCHSLKFHTTDGDWVYEAGGTGGGASVSRDGGRTFRKAKRGLEKNYGIVCAADPGNPEIWYVCVAPSPFNAFGENPQIYLYRRTNGTGWQPIGWESHPMPAAPTALVTLPGAPGQLYAGLQNGEVWHTSNYGDSWTRLPFSFDGIWFSLVVIESPSGRHPEA